MAKTLSDAIVAGQMLGRTWAVAVAYHYPIITTYSTPSFLRSCYSLPNYTFSPQASLVTLEGPGFSVVSLTLSAQTGSLVWKMNSGKQCRSIPAASRPVKHGFGTLLRLDIGSGSDEVLKYRASASRPDMARLLFLSNTLQEIISSHPKQAAASLGIFRPSHQF